MTLLSLLFTDRLPGATIAPDMQPEYIAVSDDSRKALVVCKENNAVARIDLPPNVFGKLIATRNLAAQQGLLNTTVAFEQQLTPGLYLINLQAGEKRFSQRLVIQ